MRPHLRYFGAKWSIAQWVVDHLPRHDCFVEVFGGSAAVLLTKSRSHAEVYNDLNGAVVEFFVTLRGHGEELARLVELTPFALAEFELSFEPHACAIERARRFVVRSWMTRGGYRRADGGSFSRSRGVGRSTSLAVSWLAAAPRLRAVAERLRGVTIECLDWREIIERYDAPGTLFYLDPPYVRSTRGAKYEYSHEMLDADHIELLEHLNAIQGLAVLSGYPSELYGSRLVNWRRHTTSALLQTARKATECLWLSPNASARGIQRSLDLETP